MTAPSAHTLQYGAQAITYEVAYAPRKTLAISVHPDLRVTVSAPEGTPLGEIAARVARRARWILKRQRQYETYLPHLPPRQYVSGETHRYLGRQYRLKVERGEPEGVALGRDRIQVTVGNEATADEVRELLMGWYRERAGEVFAERLAECLPRMEHLGIGAPELAIRTMSSRWGSASAAGRVTLNVKLVQMPKACIDYVILHELCHLVEPHHSPAYYALLERVLPDWRERRERLNRQEMA